MQLAILSGRYSLFSIIAVGLFAIYNTTYQPAKVCSVCSFFMMIIFYTPSLKDEELYTTLCHQVRAHF